MTSHVCSFLIRRVLLVMFRASLSTALDLVVGVVGGEIPQGAKAHGLEPCLGVEPRQARLEKKTHLHVQ